jgi:hypothetical protein
MCSTPLPPPQKKQSSYLHNAMWCCVIVPVSSYSISNRKNIKILPLLLLNEVRGCGVYENVDEISKGIFSASLDNCPHFEVC